MTHSPTTASRTSSQVSQSHNVRKCPVLSGPTDLPGETGASPDSQATCAQNHSRSDRTSAGHPPSTAQQVASWLRRCWMSSASTAHPSSIAQQVGRGDLARLPLPGRRPPTWLACQPDPASRPPTVEHVSDVLLSCLAINDPVSQPLPHIESLMIDSTALVSKTPAQASQPHNVRKCPVLSGPTDLPGETGASPDSQATCAHNHSRPDRTSTGHPPAQPPQPEPPTAPSSLNALRVSFCLQWRGAKCLRHEQALYPVTTGTSSS